MVLDVKVFPGYPEIEASLKKNTGELFVKVKGPERIYSNLSAVWLRALKARLQLRTEEINDGNFCVEHPSEKIIDFCHDVYQIRG